jgi:anhydro-N-acetylmuramic acid kinase
MNHLSRKLGEEFDRGGTLASKGIMIDSWFNELNSLDFYRKSGPKSLGMEWVETNIFPFFSQTRHSVEDLLHTYSKHVAFQIGREIGNNFPSDPNQKRILATGGGAYNNFLIENLQQSLGAGYEVIVPEDQVVEFKEALIFAFLGLLRWKNQVNVLRSVTGAKSSHSGGTIFNNNIEQ